MRHKNPLAHYSPIRAQRAREREQPSYEEKRDAILAVAEEMFAVMGYSKTTIEQVADALGVTKPYVYYYFSSKQEIFETLSWKPAVACFTVMDFEEDDQRPAYEKVMEGLERLVRATIEHHPSAFFAYREPQVYSKEYMLAQKRLANHFYDQLCPLLEQARADEMLDFENTKLTALAACSIPGFLFHWYRPEGRLGREDVIREITKAVYRVIGLKIS